MKQKLAIGIVVLAVITFISGVSILAYATKGTQEDPAVPLSYLMDVFKPQIIDDVKRIEQEMTERFNSHIATLESQLQANNGNVATDAPDSDTFSVVTIKKGQSLTCSVGVEIMLRIGSATGFGTTPALVNYTDGATLSSGAALTTNKMYLVTIEGNGIKATSETVRVLVRGDYNIS